MDIQGDFSHQNKQQYEENYKQIMGEAPPITYSSKDNQDAVRKYEGYIKIFKKKQDGNAEKQYFQSPLVKDVVKSKGTQCSSDIVEKYIKAHKIKQQYGTNFSTSNIPDITSLEEKFGR